MEGAVLFRLGTPRSPSAPLNLCGSATGGNTESRPMRWRRLWAIAGWSPISIIRVMFLPAPPLESSAATFLRVRTRVGIFRRRETAGISVFGLPALSERFKTPCVLLYFKWGVHLGSVADAHSRIRSFVNGPGKMTVQLPVCVVKLFHWR